MKKFENLDLAALEGIRAWDETEGKISNDLRSISHVNTEFVKSFVKLWMLRSITIALADKDSFVRDQKYSKFAAELNNVVKPKIMSYSDQQLPSEIQSIAENMRDSGVTMKNGTKTLEISCVSKFAFCLRPEIIVPYDKTARVALKEMYGTMHNDYSSYSNTFLKFKNEVDNELDMSGILQKHKLLWEPVMSQNLFKIRTCDKLMMLNGGFNPALMERSIEKWLKKS